MSDFSIKFVEGVIPGLDVNQDVLVTTVDQFTNAFLIPACSPQQTAGIGRATGGAMNDTLANAQATAQLVDVDTLTFTDGDASSSFDNLVGCHVVEYIGGVGGPNEVKVRAVQSFNGTASQFDGPTINGIVDVTKAVAFVFEQGNLNSGAWTSHAGTAQIVDTGGGVYVVRINKSNGTNTLNVVAYIVEFTGSNWTVQKVAHTFAASNTNEDATISSVGNVANAFVYTTFQPKSTGADDMLHYVWLTSTTNLRHRLFGSVTSGPTSYSYVISNPQLNVTVYGADPDGTSDLAASGSSPETRNITITAVPDKNQVVVLGFSGSDNVANTNRPGALVLYDLTTTTNLRLRRSISDGATEYKIQIIDFSGLISDVISSVDQVIDGQAFDVHGIFSNVVHVYINGVEQTLTADDGDSATCTAVLGDNRYDTPYLLTVDTGTQILTAPNPVQIGVSATKGYVNLQAPLVAPPNRITTNPDLVGTEQVEWSLVIGGGATDVIVYPDAAFSVAPGITQFSVRAHDGASWGSPAIQEVSAPVPPKTKAISCPLPAESL